MPPKKNDILYIIAVVCAIWFALAGMVWVYWAALFIAYPFALLSYIVWRFLRRDENKRNKIIPWILSVGLSLSLLMLFYLLIFD